MEEGERRKGGRTEENREKKRTGTGENEREGLREGEEGKGRVKEGGVFMIHKCLTVWAWRRKRRHVTMGVN